MNKAVKYLSIFVPPVVVTAGGPYGIEWAGNLFTGWAIFALFVGLCSAFAVSLVPESIEDSIERIAYRPTWRKYAGRITTIYELGVCFAMGWWVTGIVHLFGWAFHLGTFSMAKDYQQKHDVAVET